MTGRDNSLCDVFISYKAEDRPRLTKLVSALEAEGLKVWWDTRIAGGANWRHEIERHLDSARCVVVAWSKRAVGPEGQFVRDEAARALKNGTYLPIRLDRVDPPLGFGEVQAMSLEGWKGNAGDPRFQALVEAVQARARGDVAPPGKVVAGLPKLSRRAAVALGLGSAALLGIGGWSLLPLGRVNNRRIAVLPFANLSNDPDQAYFSDGITEELRSALSRVGLEVIGRASSEAVKDLDSKAASAKLKVSHLLTGSVRRSAEIIRITAQLVDGKSGVETWAQSYDRAPGDAISIQTDIASSVARALSIALGTEAQAALTLGGTMDSIAQDLVFRARERRIVADSRESFAQALTLADRAITRDPQYAAAFVERSMILITLSENYPADENAPQVVAQAEVAAKRASQIAPRLGAAHVALARIAYNRLDFPGILRETEAALALSPDDTDVLLEAASTMATFGRHQEAIRLSDRLIALDGLGARAFARRSLVMLLARRYEDAIRAVDQANAIAPGNAARFATAGDAWQLLGNPVRAMAEYAKMPADDYLRLTGEGIVSARKSDREGANRAISNLREAYGETVTYQIAVIEAQIGAIDRAFDELEKAVTLKDPGLVGLSTDPFLDPIRKDPRYATLIARLRFP